MNKLVLSLTFILILIASTTLPITNAGGPPFDFTIALSPFNQTVEQSGIALYQILLTYSDPVYSGTVITIQIMGLGPGMTYSSTMAGTLSIMTSHNTPPGIYNIKVIGSAQNVTHQTSATLVVTAKFDYSVNISPPTQTVEIGKITTFTLTISQLSGTSKPVSLTLSGLPGDINRAFSVTSNNPPYTSKLTVDTSTSTSPGTYTITITATGGGKTKTATATLIIKGAPDFSLSISPNTASGKQGEEVSFDMTVKPIESFDHTVALSVSGLPSGATPLITVPSGKPLFTSSITIDLSLSTPEGSYPITIVAAGGGKSHSTIVTLKVEKRPRQSSSLTISASSQGGQIKISGALTPPLEGTKVSLLYQGPDGRTVTHMATIGSNGGFRDAYPPDASGEWIVSVSWPGNEKYEASTSQRANITFEETFDIQSFISNPTNILLLIVAILALIAIALAVRKR